jgi:hypothetical protein
LAWGGISGVGSATKNTFLYIYSGEVKEIDVFLEIGGFFGNIFWGGPKR